MEILEYSRYYARLTINEFTTVPKIYGLSIILTDLMRFMLSFVC